MQALPCREWEKADKRQTCKDQKNNSHFHGILQRMNI